MKLRVHLETALNLAVLAVSLLVIVIFVSQYLNQNPNKPGDDSLRKGYCPSDIRTIRLR